MEREGAALVAAVAADPGASVAAYEGWTLADLARHVGQVQHWVTDLVARAAEERTPMPEAAVADAEVVGWLAAATTTLVGVLRACDLSGRVWSISRDERTNAFWARRMALEVTLHRWDAEDALGRRSAVADDVALAGVDEALRLYLEQRLEGRDVGGSGQRVGFEAVVESEATTDATPAGSDASSDATRPAWTLQLEAAGVVLHDGLVDADAVVRGSPLELWLLLSRRRTLDAYTVEGDREAAGLAVRAANLVAGPAG